MRRTLIALAAVAALALSVSANEKPTAAYQKAMHDNGDAMQVTRAAAKDIEESGSGFQDYDPFAKTTATMKAAFTETLAYWQSQKVDDAIKLSQEALKQVDALESGAKERDYRVVLAAMNALGETCTTCHMAHRGRLADGSYEIK